MYAGALGFGVDTDLLELELELELDPRLKPEPASAYGDARSAADSAARMSCFFMKGTPCWTDASKYIT
ncbi:hypothetical protein WJ87_06125 [Burkholderia ubonensis]|nr:hypothetical protein WJ87_06125 [Burkholderia ubonensis]